MKKRAHQSAKRIETATAVSLLRKATLALGLFLSPAGVTLAQQPPPQEQRQPTAPAGVAARLFTLPSDTRTLQLRLMRSMLWVWWLVALVALASGFYSVVLQNFGFGSWTDYIKCFFGGFGFSVAGTQLEQLT